jgi:hypothetical protein
MIGVEELDRLLQTARPGTQFQILQISVPVDSESPVPAASSEAAQDSMPPAGTTEDFASWVRHTHGREALKVDEWVPLVRERFGISGRRIKDAVKSAEIPSSPKRNGRDHRAPMVEIEPMCSFLDRYLAERRADAPLVHHRKRTLR